MTTGQTRKFVLHSLAERQAKQLRFTVSKNRRVYVDPSGRADSDYLLGYRGYTFWQGPMLVSTAAMALTR